VLHGEEGSSARLSDAGQLVNATLVVGQPHTFESGASGHRTHLNPIEVSQSEQLQFGHMFAASNPLARRRAIAATSAGLVVISGLSYTTSLGRELFLVGSSYGTDSLDRASVVLTAATVLGSIIGLAAQMTWGTGRSIRGFRLGYWALPIPALLTAPIFGFVPVLATLLCVMLADYHLHAQRAANRERLHVALLGSLFASLFSIALWGVFGAASVESILAGYVVGAAFQMAVARQAGSRAIPAGSAGSIGPARSVAVASLALGHGLLAKVLLLGFDTGVVAAAGLAFNAISALSVIVAYPFASAVLAGRREMNWSLRQVGGATLFFGIVGIILSTVFEIEQVTTSRLVAGASTSLHILGLMLASLPLVVATGVLLRTPAVLSRSVLLIGSLTLSLLTHLAIGSFGVLAGSITITVVAYVVGQAALPLAFLGRRSAVLMPKVDDD